MMLLLVGLALGQEPEDPETTEAPEAAEADELTPEQLAEAETMFKNGVRLYEEAHYKEAIAAFTRSYKISGAHALLFNIANAAERNGDLKGAVEALNTYRAYAPDEERATLERRVAALERRMDDERRAERKREEEAAAASAAAAAAAAAAAQSSAPVTTTESNPAKWVVLGTGLGTSALFGALATVGYSQGQAAIDAANEDQYGGAKALNNASLGGLVVGLGLTTVGIALPAKKQVTTVSVAVDRSGTLVTTNWRF